MLTGLYTYCPKYYLTLSYNNRKRLKRLKSLSNRALVNRLLERTFWFHSGDPLGLSLLGILLLSEATEGLFRGLSFFLFFHFYQKIIYHHWWFLFCYFFRKSSAKPLARIKFYYENEIRPRKKFKLAPLKQKIFSLRTYWFSYIKLYKAS